jgi:hypothetical protein
MKWIWWLLSLIFLSFVIVQYNDPDPWSWVLIYALITTNCVLMGMGLQKPWFSWLSLILLLVLTALWLPGAVDWFRLGMPSLVESMKAEKSYIEEGREFLGLVLADLTLIGALFQSRKKTSPH